MISAKVIGADVLARRLRAMVPELYAKIPQALDQGGQEVVGLARALAPYEDGALRDSLRVERGEHELSRRIIAGDETAFYARWVEHGTKTAAAQPFFWPAWRAMRRKVKARISRRARAAIKAAARR